MTPSGDPTVTITRFRVPRARPAGLRRRSSPPAAATARPRTRARTAEADTPSRSRCSRCAAPPIVAVYSGTAPDRGARGSRGRRQGRRRGPPAASRGRRHACKCRPGAGAPRRRPPAARGRPDRGQPAQARARLQPPARAEREGTGRQGHRGERQVRPRCAARAYDRARLELELHRDPRADRRRGLGAPHQARQHDRAECADLPRHEPRPAGGVRAHPGEGIPQARAAAGRRRAWSTRSAASASPASSRASARPWTRRPAPSARASRCRTRRAASSPACSPASTSSTSGARMRCSCRAARSSTRTARCRCSSSTTARPSSARSHTGLANNGWIEVVAGLKGDERVVVVGQAGLKTGTAVKVVDADAPAAGPAACPGEGQVTATGARPPPASGEDHAADRFRDPAARDRDHVHRGDRAVRARVAVAPQPEPAARPLLPHAHDPHRAARRRAARARDAGDAAGRGSGEHHPQRAPGALGVALRASPT